MASSPRVVFFGTPEFAAYILRYLVQRGVNIVAAVTTPDKPQGRGLRLRPSEVKIAAEEAGIPVLTPESPKSPELVSQLESFRADLFCVVAYKILPKSVFTLPTLGSFNIHASLLPKYRGAAPINWAIMRGEKETGITTFLLQEKVDTGNILLRQSTAITENMTAGELHDTLMHIGAEVALETINGLAAGTLAPAVQNDAESTTAPKIFPKDCIINFDQDAEQVHNFIQGLSPYPAAITTLPNGAKLKILRTVIAKELKKPAGQFFLSEDSKKLFVGTTSAVLEIVELQREGKKPMKTEEFLRGARDLFTN